MKILPCKAEEFAPENIKQRKATESLQGATLSSSVSDAGKWNNYWLTWNLLENCSTYVLFGNCLVHACLEISQPIFFFLIMLSVFHWKMPHISVHVVAVVASYVHLMTHFHVKAGILHLELADTCLKILARRTSSPN